MNTLKILLALATCAIYLFTAIATANHGANWPAVAINDLMSLNWRSQFDFDFIAHLLLLATWIVWREGATTKAYLFGFLSVFMGGMFTLPYFICAIVIASGEPKAFLLGIHAKPQI